jgi:hypothetical protein
VARARPARGLVASSLTDRARGLVEAPRAATLAVHRHGVAMIVRPLRASLGRKCIAHIGACLFHDAHPAGRAPRPTTAHGGVRDGEHAADLEQVGPAGTLAPGDQEAARSPLSTAIARNSRAGGSFAKLRDRLHTMALTPPRAASPEGGGHDQCSIATREGPRLIANLSEATNLMYARPTEAVTAFDQGLLDPWRGMGHLWIHPPAPPVNTRAPDRPDGRFPHPWRERPSA